MRLRQPPPPWDPRSGARGGLVCGTIAGLTFIGLMHVVPALAFPLVIAGIAVAITAVILVLGGDR